jgi:glycosyltransferase involved in cell wall biosynthesis
MRIGLLTTSFPRNERDIAGAFVLGFARSLAAAGHDIDVLAPEPREREPAPSWPGVHVRHVPYLRPRRLERTFYGAGVPDNLARDPVAWLGLLPFSCGLAHAARRCGGDWDAVFSHWALPCALAAGWARRRAVHIAVLHSADVHLLTRLPGRTGLAGHIAKGASALWFVSDEHRLSFLELLPRGHAQPRTLVCPMGIDLPIPTDDDRERVRRRYGLRGFSVLSLGRLVPIKGIDTAIRAVATGGMTLVVAGEGPERARLAVLARKLHADVRFVGNVIGQHKTDLFRAVDAFALPSRRMPSGRSEGMPTALLEAMAHGLPVAASRVAGIEQLLSSTPLARWLLPSEDPFEWANALHAMRVSDPARLAAAQTGRAIAEQYAWRHVAARALRLLDACAPRSQLGSA